MNIKCKLFGHKKMILWCQQEGWKCLRCPKEVIYREKPISEWPIVVPVDERPKKSVFILTIITDSV